jgi:ATP-dependent RNA helicase HelY
MLGITSTQTKRLLQEGQLESSQQSKRKGSLDHFFTRADLARVQKRLPEILRKWHTRKRPTALRKRITTNEQQPTQLKPKELHLDSFQINAVKALRNNQSVLLSAPTGNGKTLVAEILAKDLMSIGKGMVYTSPLKALSNQKYRDFKDIFGEDKIGLVTGDVSINNNAPLLIMTTEIFRNWCLSEQEQLAETSHVVFDEFHYLDDSDRGTTWEESILFAPPHMKFLGLSATVPNIGEIADWISAVRGEKVVTIEEKKRQIPLKIRWLSPGGKIVDKHEAKQEVRELIEYQKAFRSRRHWAEE